MFFTQIIGKKSVASPVGFSLAYSCTRGVEGFFSTLFSLFDSYRFGRKPVLFGSMVLMTITILLQVFSTSWTMFTILFFISGVGRVSSYISAFVLGN